MQQIDEIGAGFTRGYDDVLGGVRLQPDKYLGKGKWRGRSPNNKLVFFPHPDDLTGRLVNVRITATGPWALKGEAV